MRLVAGGTLIVRAVLGLSGALTIAPAPFLVLQIALGILLLIGLWTPVAGTLVAVTPIYFPYLATSDPLIHVLLATLGAGLALLGPGAWSVDARLFGWKRIDLGDRRTRHANDSE